jgi:hypothetical protein
MTREGAVLRTRQRGFGLRQIGVRYWPMASGAIVVLALASAIALVFGTVVKRLTVEGAAAPEVSDARISLSPLRVADRRYDAAGAATNAAFAHVLDRWHDGATGIARDSENSLTTTVNSGRGGFLPPNLSEVAPNELQRYGR